LEVVSTHHETCPLSDLPLKGSDQAVFEIGHTSALITDEVVVMCAVVVGELKPLASGHAIGQYQDAEPSEQVDGAIHRRQVDLPTPDPVMNLRHGHGLRVFHKHPEHFLPWRRLAEGFAIELKRTNSAPVGFHGLPLANDLQSYSESGGSQE
jgi:hypothetical protein